MRSLRPKFLGVVVACLRLMGYRFATVSDALKAPRGKFACLTFDNATADNLRSIAPRLAKLGVTATLFVATKNVGAQPQAVVTWNDLKELSAKGWEIGSLGHDTVDLTAVSESEQKQLIGRARALMASHLGEAPRSFAYPFGAYDATTVSSLKEVGFEAAVTLRAAGAAPETDAPYHLRRLTLSANPITDLATVLKHGMTASHDA